MHFFSLLKLRAVSSGFLRKPEIINFECVPKEKFFGKIYALYWPLNHKKK